MSMIHGCGLCDYLGVRRVDEIIAEMRALFCRLTGEGTTGKRTCPHFSNGGNQKSPRARAGAAGLLENFGQDETDIKSNTAQDKNNTSSLAGKKDLTSGWEGVNVKSPNVDSHIWRLAPFAGAKVHTSASNAHDGRAIYWQGKRPYVRKATAAYRQPGSVDPAFSVLTPKCRGDYHG